MLKQVRESRVITNFKQPHVQLGTPLFPQAIRIHFLQQPTAEKEISPEKSLKRLGETSSFPLMKSTRLNHREYLKIMKNLMSLEEI